MNNKPFSQDTFTPACHKVAKSFVSNRIELRVSPVQAGKTRQLERELKLARQQLNDSLINRGGIFCGKTGGHQL